MTHAVPPRPATPYPLLPSLLLLLHEHICQFRAFELLLLLLLLLALEVQLGEVPAAVVPVVSAGRMVVVMVVEVVHVDVSVRRRGRGVLPPPLLPPPPLQPRPHAALAAVAAAGIAVLPRRGHVFRLHFTFFVPFFSEYSWETESCRCYF